MKTSIQIKIQKILLALEKQVQEILLILFYQSQCEINIANVDFNDKKLHDVRFSLPAINQHLTLRHYVGGSIDKTSLAKKLKILN